MIDLVAMEKVKSQAILLHQVDNEEFYDKKTQDIRIDWWAW